jgi:hypothetical protein
MLMRTRSMAVTAALLTFASLCITPAASAAAHPAASPAPRVVTLPTGEQVALYGPAGAPTSFGPPPGVTWPARDPIVGFSMHGHLYAIPASAPSALAGHLEGYDLTRLAGGPAAPAAPAAAVTPTAAGGSGSHNQWTLTVNPAPDPGAITFNVTVGLMNLDDAAKFETIAQIGPQGASFSVPQGHYYLVAVFADLENNQFTERTVVNPQFTVDAPTTVTADASSATVDPSASVSRPANLGQETMTTTRNAIKNGGLGENTDSFAGGTKLLVNPTARVNVGSLRYDTHWHFHPPDGGASYTYDLDYPASGVIPAQQDHPAPDDSALAAVDTHFASEVPGQTAATGTTAVDLAGNSFIGATFLTPLTVPAERTEYFTAAPDVHWQSSMIRLNGTFEDWFSDAVRTYQPGSHVTQTWLRGPLVPGVAQFAGAPFAPLTCPACRIGDTMSLLIEPYADSAGHVAVQPTVASGSGDTATGSFQLSSNGTVLATGSYPAVGPFEDEIPIPHAAAQYQLDYNVTRSAPWWTLSTATHTQWTFKSGPSTAELPPGWFCDHSGDTQCNVLPLLFANYKLPTDDTGHEPAGPVTGEVDISHLQGAANTAIAGFAMQVSFEGGKHGSRRRSPRSRPADTRSATPTRPVPRPTSRSPPATSRATRSARSFTRPTRPRRTNPRSACSSPAARSAYDPVR